MLSTMLRSSTINAKERRRKRKGGKRMGGVNLSICSTFEGETTSCLLAFHTFKVASHIKVKM